MFYYHAAANVSPEGCDDCDCGEGGVSLMVVVVVSVAAAAGSGSDFGLTNVFSMGSFGGCHSGVILECMRHVPYTFEMCFSKTTYSKTSLIIASLPCIKRPKRSYTANVCKGNQDRYLHNRHRICFSNFELHQLRSFAHTKLQHRRGALVCNYLFQKLFSSL